MSQNTEAARQWACPNCQFAATGDFCSTCGQGRQEWNISTMAWLRRALSDVLDLDGRFLQTVRLLVVQPGRLTQAWIEGRRASFVSPIRIYLLTSAVLFGLLAMPGLSAAGSAGVEGAIDAVIDGWHEEPLPAWYLALQEVAADDAAQARMAMSITENLPRAMFILLPFSALLLKLLIRRPRHHYVVHLVWALHAHTAVFVVVALMVLLDPLRGTAKFVVAYPIAAAGMIWASWYLVMAVSRVYARSPTRSVITLALAGILYMPMFVFTAVMLSRAAL